MYNTDSGVGDSADGVMRLRQLYAARKLSDTFHHLSEMALQRLDCLQIFYIVLSSYIS